MLQYKKLSTKHLIWVFFGLTLLFFIDDVLVVFLIREFGYLRRNSWLTGLILLWLFLASVGLAYAVLKEKQRQPITGREGLLGAHGIVISNTKQNQRVFIHGENWRAESEDNRKLKVNDQIKVVGIDGLTLWVRKVS